MRGRRWKRALVLCVLHDGRIVKEAGRDTLSLRLRLARSFLMMMMMLLWVHLRDSTLEELFFERTRDTMRLLRLGCVRLKR